ncbi:hypothetical protein R5R35_014142 [Gryllus longicercus]|uniref:Accessory gland protein n=1 Tax=Gryllus longicercus TaxID=2509291 RepID=A0AAN9VB69_9ORTH
MRGAWCGAVAALAVLLVAGSGRPAAAAPRGSEAAVRQAEAAKEPAAPPPRPAPGGGVKTRPAPLGPAAGVAGTGGKVGVAPTTIIVTPPFIASCPEGQKADEQGKCRETWR